ncbi:MAG: hypothetical protein VZR36_15075 [Prevotella sp.]|nr:hypothetical protein [Prevotella sp.]
MRNIVEEFRKIDFEYISASAIAPPVLTQVTRKPRARECHALALKARAVVVYQIRRQGRQEHRIAQRVLQDHIRRIQGADKAPATSLADDEFEALSRPVSAVNQRFPEGGAEAEAVAGDALYR